MLYPVAGVTGRSNCTLTGIGSNSHLSLMASLIMSSGIIRLLLMKMSFTFLVRKIRDFCNSQKSRTLTPKRSLIV